MKVSSLFTPISLSTGHTPIPINSTRKVYTPIPLNSTNQDQISIRQNLETPSTDINPSVSSQQQQRDSENSFIVAQEIDQFEKRLFAKNQRQMSFGGVETKNPGKLIDRSFEIEKGKKPLIDFGPPQRQAHRPAEKENLADPGIVREINLAVTQQQTERNVEKLRQKTPPIMQSALSDLHRLPDEPIVKKDEEKPQKIAKEEKPINREDRIIKIAYQKATDELRPSVEVDMNQVKPKCQLHLLDNQKKSIDSDTDSKKISEEKASVMDFLKEKMRPVPQNSPEKTHVDGTTQKHKRIYEIIEEDEDRTQARVSKENLTSEGDNYLKDFEIGRISFLPTDEKGVFTENSKML
mgnify:FL=1